MQDQKKVVLITEDEIPMLSILSDTLVANGFETLQARDGEQGLSLALQQHPDLILLDVLMPKMDGLAMIERLREDSWGKNVPVIILTNVSPDTNAILQSIIKNQPSYYFVKADMKLEHVVEKIKNILIPNSQEVFTPSE